MSVKELQRSTVDEEDYDIAFTKEYFDKVRSEAETLGDALMRTLIVLGAQDWSVQRESAIGHLRDVRMISKLYFLLHSCLVSAR